MLTEQPNPQSTHIDRLSALEIVQIMNAEDATVAAVVRAALPEIARAVEAAADRLRRGGRMIYVGAGTSGRLGMLDAVECVPTFSTEPDMVQALIAGGMAALTQAVEGAEDDPDAGRRDLLALNVTERDIVVGIAASGRTPYVLGALAAANERGAVTVGIACNAPSPVLEAAQINIAAPVGPEVIAGSTRLKAGTAQKMILNMLSTATMISLGKVYGNRMVDVKVTNQKLADRARRIVSEVVGVDEEQAARLLALADNQVKTAIVVGLLGITPEEARARLVSAHGRLSALIGEKDG
ncbi:MAG: N-acetylmuramic acid 6-phosphate etherase [Chloroflexi bacterium]|nr:N-acetylmuramic acid 6-phosphate etherase [Chloroflexota bacterium]MDL1883648.1 N-acetylmuramic acid 6-phosphate etherase [Anaerolineae bacterium CFX8]